MRYQHPSEVRRANPSPVCRYSRESLLFGERELRKERTGWTERRAWRRMVRRWRIINTRGIDLNPGPFLFEGEFDPGFRYPAKRDIFPNVDRRRQI